MALEGSLEDMSVVDLFQVFRIGPKTGVLELDAMLHQAVVYISRGQPIDASIFQTSDRRLLASGETAVLELLQWSQATFIFQHDQRIHERPPRIFRDSETLVLESVRQQEAQGCPRNQIIAIDTPLTMALLPCSGPSTVNLDLKQWRVLSQVTLCGTVRNICGQTQVAAEEVLRIANQLLALGLIEVVRQPAAAYSPPCSVQPGAPAHLLQPSFAGVASQPPKNMAPNPRPGKALLNAVMRRVRGL